MKRLLDLFKKSRQRNIEAQTQFKLDASQDLDSTKNTRRGNESSDNDLFWDDSDLGYC